ncbi:hypothetical protein KKB83_02745 [Patescibacteria group bacterium]|nr:hypothetical protein [Patescibacteria group bacterium]
MFKWLAHLFRKRPYKVYWQEYRRRDNKFLRQGRGKRQQSIEESALEAERIKEKARKNYYILVIVKGPHGYIERY